MSSDPPPLPEPKPGEVPVLNFYGTTIGHDTPERVARFYEVQKLVADAWQENRPAPTSAQRQSGPPV
jgi:hypothetical protein